MERGFALKRYAYFLFRFVKTFADIVRFSYCRKKKKKHVNRPTKQDKKSTHDTLVPRTYEYGYIILHVQNMVI